MTRRILDLSALPWQMGAAPRQPFGPQSKDDRAAVTEWLPARVPGDVRADLTAAGRIPPVEMLGAVPEAQRPDAWADDSDWWYRVPLCSPSRTDEFVVLEADGIDYLSAIWLDDQRLALHEGMFGRQVVLLSPWINAAGPHELAVRIWGGGAFPGLSASRWRRAARWLVNRLSPDIEYFPDRMARPKAQFSFGWDFAPRVLSTGIWDEIRLITVRGAYIENLWAHAVPLSEADDPTPVRWQLKLRVTRWRPGPVRAEITIAPENFDGPGYQSLHRTVTLCPEDAPACTADYEFVLEMAAARRWWPWDQGEPCLYRVTVRLLAADQEGPRESADENVPDGDRLLDEISQVSGVRSVARAAFPDGARWRWMVNGRPVFLRGANWTPADVLPGRVTPADYERLLGMAREAGVNFLRVWGGGIREKAAFWDICDRLGLMAWQEFPLACAFLDHYPRTEAYLHVLATEARGIARSLRHHPSLIAWCGGNEINPERERMPLRALTNVLTEEDPTRPWIPASPSEGDLHQWAVWHGYAPWTDLAELQAPFVSEFGLQALPDVASVAEMFPTDTPASLADPRWPARKAQVDKLCHYAGVEPQCDLPSAIIATQRAQAAALQAGIEACRLRRESPPNSAEHSAMSPCGGVAFWQFNEPWPAVTWSVVDRAGRPKMAYHMLRRSFQPVLIAARFRRRCYQAGQTLQADLWLVNDSPQGGQGCSAQAVLDGEPVWSAEGLRLPPACVVPIGELNLTLAAPPQILELSLQCADRLLATNRYDLTVHLPGRRSLVGSSTAFRARLGQWLAARLLDAG